MTSFGLVLEFTELIFDLCNAAQTYQRFKDTVLQGLQFCYCYIDDILVVSSDLYEQLLFRQVFQRLSEYGLAINPAICKFGVLEI